MPLSFKGRLIQYAGRLHRQHETKGTALIFDYLDENQAITNIGSENNRTKAPHQVADDSVSNQPISRRGMRSGEIP
jgi:superfamily II DNA or RNA helicase